jgi:predicted transcriptional regulator
MATISQQSASHLWHASETNPQAATRLGEREREVLEVLWSEGSATVQQVADGLKTALAYTTVMTTLDRLYKKGLLQRSNKIEHLFTSLRSRRTTWNEDEQARWCIDCFPIRA